MSLQDRTEDVKFVNKTTEFSMSEEWKDQWKVFTTLHENLSRKSRPVLFTGRQTPSLVVDSRLELTDEENKNLETNRGDYDGITRANLRGVHEGLMPFLPIKQIIKSFLSFNRRANYEWCFSRADKAVSDYQNIREELVEYGEHLQLPEMDAPSFDTTFVTPFVKQAHFILQRWLAERYDHEQKIVRMPPYKIIVLGDGMVDESVNLNLYNVRTLLTDLSEVFVKYDIETHFKHAQAHVVGLQNMFRKED